MKYYINKTLNQPFNEVVDKIKQTLPQHGFGVVTEFNVDEKFKEKLNVDFRKYKILGACAPQYAYETLKAEPMIGTMLPCNIIIQEHGPNYVEVAAIDPVASMLAVDNAMLQQAAETIKTKLNGFILSL
jgi:uncharacterized protein (DUF302 family)